MLWVVALLAVLVASVPVMAVVEPIASYDLAVRLDPETHGLTGGGRVSFRNATSFPTSELWFHLYLNAFASSRTTFMRELGRGASRHAGGGAGEWGTTRVTRLVTAEGIDLLSGLVRVSPDDGNEDDSTVARVRLADPLPPGGGIELDLEFEARLPAVVARTGFARDFHLAGQWFPKLGVLEESGWSCHQYHANAEFYADFANYRVAVEVPDGWLVAATGVEVQRATVEVDGARWQRLTFRAERVHDFAWSAAPTTLMMAVEGEFDPGRDVPPAWLERAQRDLGLSAAELELAQVHLRLLLPRSQASLAGRMLRSARLALAWNGLYYGPYPYPQLTIVSPPPTAEQAGGMEYPTLVTTGASRFMAYPPLRWWPWIESVTVHEVGHQYFYGLLATNEGEQAWLDEGLTTYAEVTCLDAIARDRLVPEQVGLGGWWTLERAWLGSSSLPVRADQPAWEFARRDDYFRASYGKTAVALKTLEGLLGSRILARGMRAYFQRHRFGHPAGDDLVTALSENAGQDLTWFFDQAIRGEATADWAVAGVRQQRGQDAGSGEGEPGRWQVDVSLVRVGDFVGPVEVGLGFADGSNERRQWDSQERWVTWSFSSPHQLEQVVIDPDSVWAIEVRRENNFWRAEPDRTLARRLLWWVPDALTLLGLLWLPWS